MHRFWLSWYTFILHTLMFFMACGGHAFASRTVSSDASSVEVVQQDGASAFIEEDHPHERHEGAHLLGERERIEEVEECDHSDKLDAFTMPPSELFWLSAFDHGYVIERQRGRAPPKLFTLITSSPASLWFATTRPSRGPPHILLA